MSSIHKQKAILGISRPYYSLSNIQLRYIINKSNKCLILQHHYSMLHLIIINCLKTLTFLLLTLLTIQLCLIWLLVWFKTLFCCIFIRFFYYCRLLFERMSCWSHFWWFYLRMLTLYMSIQSCIWTISFATSLRTCELFLYLVISSPMNFVHSNNILYITILQTSFD